MRLLNLLPILFSRIALSDHYHPQISIPALQLRQRLSSFALLIQPVQYRSSHFSSLLIAPYFMLFSSISFTLFSFFFLFPPHYLLHSPHPPLLFISSSWIGTCEYLEVPYFLKDLPILAPSIPKHYTYLPELTPSTYLSQIVQYSLYLPFFLPLSFPSWLPLKWSYLVWQAFIVIAQSVSPWAPILL